MKPKSQQPSLKESLPLNRIINGNCVEVLRTLPANSIDLIFADPPYNMQLKNELKRPNQTVVDGVDDAWDQFGSFAEYDEFTVSWLSECRRVLKDDGTIWVIGSYHNIFRVGNILLDLEFWILNDVIWHKTNPMPNFKGTRYQNATETLIWAKKSSEQKKYTFNYHAMKNMNDEKQMQNVWHIPICVGEERLKNNGIKAHSTQKPEALLYRVILSSSNPGDVVLDPFFGTGTTGAVAKKLQRNYIGIELETEYVEFAKARLLACETGQIDPNLLISKSKKHEPRVNFAQLIERNLISINQKLYSKDRKIEAVVKADSFLIWNEYTGSIHKISAIAQGKTNFNGWEYWHYEDSEGNLISIERLREKYRKEYLTVEIG